MNFGKNNRAMFAVWNRNFTIYRRTWVMSLVPNFFEPLIYLLGVGVGIGRYLSSGEEWLHYLAFIAPGLVIMSASNGAVFETTYNVFIRLHFNKLYQAYLATPARPQDILWGEILWSVTRALLYGCIFLFLLFIMGIFGWTTVKSVWVLASPLVIALTGLVFALLGALYTLYIPSINFFNYFFTLFLMPLTFISDVFYPVPENSLLSLLGWISPMFHAVRLQRALFTGQFEFVHLMSLLVLIVLSTGMAIWLNHRTNKVLVN